MPKLILIRHGQSIWNEQNIFTGWADVELSVKGIEEARQAAILLRFYEIDFAFTSVLKRAIHTLEIVLEGRSPQIPVFKSALLNERNYGDLQGLYKAETEHKYGLEQVLAWRRSFSTAPPNGESLKDTLERVLPYYLLEIEPRLKLNQNILIVAHGNSLRALMMHLENISETNIETINIATCIPRVYDFTVRLKLLGVK